MQTQVQSETQERTQLLDSNYATLASPPIRLLMSKYIHQPVVPECDGVAVLGTLNSVFGVEAKRPCGFVTPPLALCCTHSLLL